METVEDERDGLRAALMHSSGGLRESSEHAPPPLPLTAPRGAGDEEALEWTWLTPAGLLLDSWGLSVEAAGGERSGLWWLAAVEPLACRAALSLVGAVPWGAPEVAVCEEDEAGDDVEEGEDRWLTAGVVMDSPTWLRGPASAEALEERVRSPLGPAQCEPGPFWSPWIGRKFRSTSHHQDRNPMESNQTRIKKTNNSVNIKLAFGFVLHEACC